MPGRREQAVLIGHEPDEQKTGHQHEGGPVLRGGRAGFCRSRRCYYDGAGAAQPGRHPGGDFGKARQG